MAPVAWKPLFWERFGDAFALAGAVRDVLATASGYLSSPLRGSPAVVVITRCGEKLAEATKVLAVGISALGTVELLALRCMLTGDAAEVRARLRARAARAMATDAYNMVSSAQGHLGAAGRLLDTTGIPDHAVDSERLALLAAIEAATQMLDELQVLRTSDAALPGVSLPRADTPTRSAAEESSLVGASSDATWRVLAGSVPGVLLQVALSGALQEIEAAQAALLASGDAIGNASKAAAAEVDWFGCYSSACRALETAHGALCRLLALNNECGIVFTCCAPHLGLDRGGKGWRSWEASLADVELHGRAALDRLWSASALVDFSFAGVLAWQSQSCSWQEARGLMDHALADAGEARDASDNLRHAAGRAFLHAWMILNSGSST
uniref:Uncharacterized protein n=1 Tax=Avena sativa TaxID=4498 RepID=A0ACD5VB69_AVESA